MNTSSNKFRGKEGNAIELVNNSADARLRKLMQDHSTMVFNLCLRLVRDYFLAEDLTQDTFLSAWRNLPKFDGAHEKAWLTQIATRKCLDYLRSAPARKLRPTEDETLQAMPLPQAEQPESLFFEEHWDETLRQACEHLREPLRSVAVGYYCEGLTLRQIAQSTGQSLDATRSQCFRAKKMLQQTLKEELRT